MKIGYYVQGDTDEAVVRGLAQRWCPDAELAEGRFRGSSGESLRREIRNSLVDLRDHKECDILVVLTDADANRWQEVKRRESERIPEDYRDVTLFGVADRNIECWLAIVRDALAAELGCPVDDIPIDDPSHFVKRRFGLSNRDTRKDARTRICNYVAHASLRSWIERSASFGDLYDQARGLSRRTGCPFPNELETERRP